MNSLGSSTADKSTVDNSTVVKSTVDKTTEYLGSGFFEIVQCLLEALLCTFQQCSL